MSDVITTCFANQTQVSGRAVIKLPGCAIQHIDPRINMQMSTAVAIRKYDDRFNHRCYYYDIAAR